MCRRTSVLIAALVLTVSFAHAQTRSGRRPPPKPTVNSSEPSVPSTRRVTITLKKGETVTGNFIGADTSTVRVQVANNELKINWDEIASIQTGDASIPNIAAIPEKPTGSVLSIEAGIVYRSGDVKAVARTLFYLLDDDVGKILKDAGVKFPIVRGANNKPPETLTANDFAGMFGVYAKYGDHDGETFYADSLAALKPHIVKTATSDFTGKATFDPVAPGTYYLMAVASTPQSYAMWNMRLELKPGPFAVSLDQNNAIFAR
jgi:hypothetical protein